MLVEAGSSIARARDLLELLGWRDEWQAVDRALSLAIRKVIAVRQVVDGHLENIRARELGRETPAHAVDLLELGHAELEEHTA